LGSFCKKVAVQIVSAKLDSFCRQELNYITALVRGTQPGRYVFWPNRACLRNATLLHLMARRNWSTVVELEMFAGHLHAGLEPNPRVGCKRYYWLCISLTITRLTPGTLRIKATTNVAAANHAIRLEARSTRNCMTSLPTARLDTSRSNSVCSHASGFATESYASSALYTTLASLSGA